MSERERILAQVAENRLSIEEALALLAALDQEEGGSAVPRFAAAMPADTRGGRPRSMAGKPRFLRVIIQAKEAEKAESVDVNLCLPLAMARALGSSLAKVIPRAAQERMREYGVDFAELNLNEALDGLDDTMGSSIVDVQADDGDGDIVKVNIYVE